MVANDEILQLKEFLDEMVIRYNTLDFLATDPVSIPHRYVSKEDIEIAAFLSSTIAWGNRKLIVKNALDLMERMDDAPYDFVLHHSAAELGRLSGFVHRTFQSEDLLFFITSLQNLYQQHGGLEKVFAKHATPHSMQPAITAFRDLFFSLAHPDRTEKHVANPAAGSAAKRINMFLRWMVRRDKCGVDFGLWNSLMPSQLSCPLDLHSGRVARKLGLLTRKQDDARAVAELDANLRKLDPVDPVKYDFALFGLGVFEKF
ncbi:MAG: TIGR02757 family protein [Marinilabiliales bacterium]|nr:TIGR02757 family protein [Marinilabiliales bacterium]